MGETGDVPRARRAAYHHGDLRNVLIRAAEDVIKSEGVEAVTIRALTHSAGVFHRAAYRHFPDKNALLAAVFKQGYERLSKEIEARAKSNDVTERFRQIASAFADFAFAEPNLFLAMSGPRVNVAEQSIGLEEALNRAFLPTLAAVRHAQTEGSIPRTDAQVAAIFFWAALQGVITQIIYGRIKVATAKRALFVRQTSDRLLAGLSSSSK